MAKYVTKPRRHKAECDECDWGMETFHLASNLIVHDHEAQPIGVLDASGNEFYRMPEPMGFQVDED